MKIWDSVYIFIIFIRKYIFKQLHNKKYVFSRSGQFFGAIVKYDFGTLISALGTSSEFHLFYKYVVELATFLDKNKWLISTHFQLEGSSKWYTNLLLCNSAAFRCYTHRKLFKILFFAIFRLFSSFHPFFIVFVLLKWCYLSFAVSSHCYKLIQRLRVTELKSEMT